MNLKSFKKSNSKKSNFARSNLKKKIDKNITTFTTFTDSYEENKLQKTFILVVEIEKYLKPGFTFVRPTDEENIKYSQSRANHKQCGMQSSSA